MRIVLAVARQLMTELFGLVVCWLVRWSVSC